MSKPENPHVFPFQASNAEEMHDPSYGITLREWFAGHALGAATVYALANVEDAAKRNLLPEEWAAKIAWRIADEMLATRQGPGS